MTLPSLKIEDDQTVLAESFEEPRFSEWGLSDADVEALDAMKSEGLRSRVAEVFGGPGSGPRPGYKRSKDRPEGKSGSHTLEGPVPERYRAAVDSTMNSLVARYPIGPVRVRFASGDDAITAYATAQSGDPLVPANPSNPSAGGSQAIHANADEWTAQAETREAEFKPYLVDSRQPEGTITHEYGHLVERAMRRAAPGRAAEIDALLELGGVDRTEAGYDSLDSPSVYGMESRGEMAAELFSAHVTGRVADGRSLDDPAVTEGTRDRVAKFGALVDEIVGAKP